MKTCGYCSNGYDDKESKCPHCGSTLLKQTKGTNATEEYDRIKAEIAQKRKSRSIILLSCAVVVTMAIVMAISSVIGFINNPQRAIAKASIELLNQAEQQVNDGKFDDALDTLTQIDTKWDDYEKVNDIRLEAIKGQLEAKLAEYEATSNYQAIISMINENISNVNADPDIKAAYESAVQSYKAEAISTAEAFAVTGDYISARSALTVAINFIGEDVEIQEKLKELNQSEVMGVVLSYESESNYKDAIIYLNDQSSVVSGSADLQAKLSTYTAKYRESVINDAANSYKADGYEAAVTTLNSALKVLPGDATINAEKAKYEQAVPVPLTEMDVTKQGEYLRVGNYYGCPNQDVNGKTYSIDGTHWLYDLDFSKPEGKNSITYFLNQNYDILTGIIYRPYITLSCWFDWSSDGKVKIYGDDTLLYEGSISQNSYDTISFTVDVSGVRELTIELNGIWREEQRGDVGYRWHPKLCLTELNVAKEP